MISSRRATVLALLATLTTAAACGDRPKTDFDGKAALGHIRTQLAFGPRIPGSEGARKTGDWIVAQMKPLVDTVVEQRWTHVTAKGDTLPLRNILARIRPNEKQRVLYVTHWDTRPVADSDPDPGKRREPVMGANDGASGPAMFIEIARVLKKTPPQFGVDFLFVDGEDYGDFGTDTDVLLGSKYFADHLPEADYRPLFGVLWDMIADADLRLPEEANSVQAAPEVVARVWGVADDLGYDKYFPQEPGYAVTDDHVPLLKKGLRVIDVVDIDYVSQQNNYHHTTMDTIDKVSSKSLQVVGDVAVSLVWGR